MMPDMEKVINWLEYDYLPRVGAYRKDCKQGCDACMPMHDGDDYCDIDMLCKILAMLKEKEAVEPFKTELHDEILERDLQYNACGCCGFILYPKSNYCQNCGKKVKYN